MRFHSFAKVNLHLEVLRRREDGYHDLRTIFQSIDLADEIEIVRTPGGVGLEVAGAGADSYLPAVPEDESNLAWRAAASYLARWGSAAGGVGIRLTKRIPVGGGLGGGSANAATVLLGLCVLDGRDPRGAELDAIAADLGSDVAFFLHGGSAIGTGRGERIEALPDPDAEPLELWLAVPPVGVATREVFAAHRLGGSSGSASGVRRTEKVTGLAAPWNALLGWNDLEPTCLALYPAVRDVYNRVSESGALAVRLSGSGSTIFALYADRAAGQAAGDRLGSDTIWLPVKTLSRAEWLRRSGFDVLAGGI